MAIPQWARTQRDQLGCAPHVAEFIARKVLLHCKGKRRAYERIMHIVAQAAKDVPLALRTPTRKVYLRALRTRVLELAREELRAREEAQQC